MLAPDRFRFLNSERFLRFPSAWNDPASQKLWLYNLHYFDDLNAEGAGARRDWHTDLIARWITENLPGTGNGWEPYPLSLRIVNWVKWVLAGNRLPDKALQSLATQTRFLGRRLEYHLLGNHLFANAKALIFAGLFFDGEEANEWLGTGFSILETEVPEQILADGGHFERSPMYHAIILEDLLDLINLLRSYGHPVPLAWENICPRMLTWLRAMTHPDGEISLFNDAAFGIAPTLAALQDYAERLGLGRPSIPHQSLTHLAESGYVRSELEDAVLLLDTAPVGPDYLPGHAHADTLSFELSVFRQRVIVNSGTSTYEKNDERQRQRGTAAHNTVAIDDADSSEVWGGFRVARRARPLCLETESAPGLVRVSCAHDGYRRLSGKPIHRRQWQLATTRLLVQDRIEGGFDNAVARYHFHPEIQIELESSTIGSLLLATRQIISFRITGGVARLVDTTYHPEFNLAVPNRCLEISLSGSELEVLFSWDQ